MILTLLSLTALAAPIGLHAPDFQLTLAEHSGSLEITATPPAGNHINTDAPAYLQIEGTPKRLKAAKASPRSLLFKITPAHPLNFVVSLFLCDDAKTYCENHQISGRWEGTPAASSKEKPKAAIPSPTENVIAKAPALRKGWDHGFLLNQPELALKLAQEGKKPLMIDFFGIWCPPCNMLDKDVFSSPEFKKASSDFVKLKLDADSEISWTLRSRYRVGGYPTVLFASPQGDEILRIVGFRPKEEFLKEIARAWNLRNEPIMALKTKADAGDLPAMERLGLLHLDRREYADAIRYLEKVPTRQQEKFEARIGLLEADKSQEDLLVKTLEESITLFPDSPESVENRAKLARLFEDRKQPERKKALLEDAIHAARKLLQNPAALIGKDFTKADILASIADAREELGDPLAQEDWALAAAEFGKGTDGSTKERGNNLEQAYCLWKAGKNAEADRIYSALEKAYPREFTFWYAHASMKFQLKKPGEAEPLARKAHQFSYGDNRLRASLLLAKIYQAGGKKEKARDLINSELKAMQLPEDKTLRTHKYAQSLKDFVEKLN